MVAIPQQLSDQAKEVQALFGLGATETGQQPQAPQAPQAPQSRTTAGSC